MNETKNIIQRKNFMVLLSKQPMFGAQWNKTNIC